MQYCHDGYRISYSITASNINQKTPQVYGGRSFSGCFDTGIYDDATMNGTFSKFTLTMRRLGTYITLGELELYIGQDNPSPFKGSNLQQDGPRTWLVVSEPKPVSYDLDVLDVRGHAHLAIQNEVSEVGLSVQEYKGDFTGTLHVGSKQRVDISANNNSVIPFNIRAYQVSAFSFIIWREMISDI